MTITTGGPNGGRYHVGTVDELRQLLAALQGAGLQVQAVQLAPVLCWYCDRRVTSTDGRCDHCSQNGGALSAADWRCNGAA